MRKVGDSNPRYGKPVRQFSKLVVSATHPTFQTYSDIYLRHLFVSINIAPKSAFATGILRLYYSRFRIASAKVVIFFYFSKYLLTFLYANLKKSVSTLFFHNVYVLQNRFLATVCSNGLLREILGDASFFKEAPPR